MESFGDDVQLQKILLIATLVFQFIMTLYLRSLNHQISKQFRLMQNMITPIEQPPSNGKNTVNQMNNNQKSAQNPQNQPNFKDSPSPNQPQDGEKLVGLIQQIGPLQKDINTLDSQFQKEKEQQKSLIEQQLKIAEQKMEEKFKKEISSEIKKMVDEFQQKIEKLSADFQNDINQKNDKFQELNAEIQELKQQNDNTIQKEIKQLNDQIQKLKQQNDDKVQKEIQQPNAEQQELIQQNDDKIQKEIKQLNAQIQELKQQNDDTIQKEIKQLNDQIQKLKQQNDDKIQQEIQQLNAQQQELIQQNDDKIQEMKQLNAQIQELKQQNVKIQDEIKQLNGQFQKEQLNGQILELQQQNVKIQEEIQVKIEQLNGQLQLDINGKLQGIKQQIITQYNQDLEILKQRQYEEYLDLRNQIQNLGNLQEKIEQLKNDNQVIKEDLKNLKKKILPSPSPSPPPIPQDVTIIPSLYNKTCRARSVEAQYRDFVSDILNQKDLILDYGMNKLEIKTQLKKYLNGMRRARGDGNCFYTSFVFQYLDFMINKTKTDQFEQLFQQISMLPFEIYYQNELFNQTDFDILRQKFVAICKKLRSVNELERQNLFFQYFKDEENEFYGLSIVFLRNLAFKFCLEDSEVSGTFQTLGLILKDQLLEWEFDCQNNEVVINLLSLKLNIQTILFQIENQNLKILQYNECSNPMLKIYLLFRPGHYNIGVPIVQQQQE
ncbi:unnamed protein product [Paramecium octaurelia]|uniref:OTU domain-containing protein n=1 Tax=Paramecium octaurelia TaxID=43137 RepID=A0A8S1RYT0_PAROT|nr:unnamed protein product [Paramecium octaurelia]